MTADQSNAADVGSVVGPPPATGALTTEPPPRPGLSWSWDLDLETLLAALAEPAPWNHLASSTPGPATLGPATPGPATPGPATPGPATPGPATPGPATVGPATPHSATPESPALDPTTPLPPPELVDAPDPAPDPDSVEADLADYLAAVEAGRAQTIPLEEVAGRVAESLPTGPGLAGWLATGSVRGLENGALAGMAASYRRLASWAQAGELAVVAELASRSAAADAKIGIDEQGRPLRLADEACAQVSLALTMSQASASWWSDLGVTLSWRLAATGAALRAGLIDLGRARLIAEATTSLDEEKARTVEARVLPRAGEQTTGQLRAALRRAVITADPEGAERRREEAERRARVTLYPDAEGTASLAGYSLPGIRAAAAMARITALARAMKAAGAGGGIDLLRAQVFLGLLLGTLPYIPPSPDGPPDDPPPDDPPPADPTVGPFGADAPGEHASGDGPQDGEPPGARPDEFPGGHPGRRSASAIAPVSHRRHGSPSADSCPNAPPDGPGAGPQLPSPRPASPRPASPLPTSPKPPGPREPRPGDLHPDASLDEQEPRGGQPGRDEPRLDHPCPYEADGPPSATPTDDDDPWPDSRPPPAWPQVQPFLRPGPAAMGNLQPAVAGLLDLRVPWTTLTGESGEPGHLSRLGPVTPAQACHLADLAAEDGAVQWRVIVTSLDGRALAVTRVPRDQVTRSADSRAHSDSSTGLVGRITVTIGRDTLSYPAAAHPAPDGPAADRAATDLPEILAGVLRAAERAVQRADEHAAADAATAGGCAHHDASSAYRPSARLWEYVTARDLTCRFPTCRQPAWRCDLDHTTPYDKGGRTCRCNLGGLCRFHHQLKQHLRWHLAQFMPGTFTWTTPAGRTYTAEPDSHPV